MKENFNGTVYDFFDYFFNGIHNHGNNNLKKENQFCEKCNNQEKQSGWKLKEIVEDYRNNKNQTNDNYSERGKYRGYKLENIVENDINCGVKLIYAVPGLDKKDICVSVKDNIVFIKSDKEVFYFGKLDAQIKIKFDVLVKNVKCTCENGMLVIDILREKNELTENIISID